MLSTAAANRCVSAASLGCRQDFRRNWLAKSKAAWLGVRSTRQRCGARVEAGKREEGETAGKRGEDEQPPASSRPGWNEEAEAKAKWMELLEADADKDPAVKELLDGVEGGDFDEVEKRIRERFEQKKERIYKEKEGSTVPMLVTFREWRPSNIWLWAESYNRIEPQEQAILEEVFKSWFVLGKLGAFNVGNLQVQDNFDDVVGMEYDISQANSSDVTLHCFHAMGEPEFNGKWCRIWFDLGSADEISLDILINSLINFSRDYFGIKQFIVGGVNDDWPVEDSEYYVNESQEEFADDALGPFRPPPSGDELFSGAR